MRRAAIRSSSRLAFEDTRSPSAACCWSEGRISSLFGRPRPARRRLDLCGARPARADRHRPRPRPHHGGNHEHRHPRRECARRRRRLGDGQHHAADRRVARHRAAQHAGRQRDNRLCSRHAAQRCRSHRPRRTATPSRSAGRPRSSPPAPSSAACCCQAVRPSPTPAQRSRPDGKHHPAYRGLRRKQSDEQRIGNDCLKVRHVPELVQNWSRVCSRPGRRRWRLSVSPRGEMRTKPSAKRRRFEASEDFAVARVAFSWRARFPIVGPQRDSEQRERSRPSPSASSSATRMGATSERSARSGGISRRASSTGGGGLRD